MRNPLNSLLPIKSPVNLQLPGGQVVFDINYPNDTEKMLDLQRTKVPIPYRTRVMLMHFGAGLGGVNAQPN